MKVTSLFTLAFAALSAASPLEVEKRTSSQQLATYDDLKAVPALSQVNPVGTYRTPALFPLSKSSALTFTLSQAA